jgi:hypothetical protein
MLPNPESDLECAAYGFGYSIGWMWRQLKRLNRWLAGG